jgi:hypothetical protein
MNSGNSGGPAVKIVQLPKEYPSQRMAASYRFTEPQLVYAIAEAAALEVQFEQMTAELKLAVGGSKMLERAMALTEVEDQLLQRYFTVNSAIDHTNAEANSRKMLAETALLAKERSKPAKTHQEEVKHRRRSSRDDPFSLN